MNFMELNTQIGGLVEKQKEIFRKIANMLSSAIVERSKKNQYKNLSNDIKTSLKDLSDNEKVEVLTETVVILAKQLPSNDSSSNKRERESSIDSIFKSRGFR